MSLALISIAALGCGGAEGSAERQARTAALLAVTVGKAEPPSSCRFIGAQQATDPKAYAPFASLAANSDDALDELRRKAVDRGANYAVLDFVAGPMAQGRLYACPPGAIPGQPGAPPPPGPPGAPCRPDCSPGYACVDGACVSACNPPCGPGQQCGADRVCHGPAGR